MHRLDCSNHQQSIHIVEDKRFTELQRSWSCSSFGKIIGMYVECRNIYTSIDVCTIFELYGQSEIYSPQNRADFFFP